MRFGQCRAMVDDKAAPHPCTRWAVSETGWCGQHYASEVERERREQRETKRRDELNARIDAHIAMAQENPWFWLDYLVPAAESHIGIEPSSGVKVQSADQQHREDDPEPDAKGGDGDGSQVRHGKPPFRIDATPVRRKGPYRIDAPA